MSYDFNPKDWFCEFSRLPAEVASCTGLSPGEKIIYSRLMNHFNSTLGYACVRVAVLAEEIGCNVRMTKELISRLVEIGLVRRVLQAAENKPSKYYFSNPEPILEILSDKKRQPEKDNSSLNERLSTLKKTEALSKNKTDQLINAKGVKEANERKTIMERTLKELVGIENIKRIISNEKKARGLTPTDSELRPIWVHKIQTSLNSRNSAAYPGLSWVRKAITELQQTWTTEFKNNGFGYNNAGNFISPKWIGKESAQIIQLLDRYCGNDLQTAIKYIVRQWSEISERYLKGKGIIPTLSFLLRFHDSLIPESQQWIKSIDVVEEYEKWKRENPTKIRPPGDLLDRYVKAKKELSAIGLDH